jgi:hypothetical protein
MGPPIKFDLERRIHGLVKPVMRIGMMYAEREVAAIVAEKRRVGWQEDWVRRLDAANNLFNHELVKMRMPYQQEIQGASGIVCAILDTEPVWGRRWWSAWIRALQSLDLLKEIPDPPNTTIPLYTVP